MQLHVYKNADDVCEALAAWIAALIEKTLISKKIFTWALAGGETPKKLYTRLAAAPYDEKIKWDRIHIFWGDERVVPFGDERNNAKMADDSLLGKVKIPTSNIHRMWTDINAGESAKQYEKMLHTYFDDRAVTFDLVLCGMGEDGHTLSIFPRSNLPTGWVAAVHSKEKGERITLLPAVVNAAAAVVFLVTGEKKAGILKEIWDISPQKNYPAQLINPANGELHWFVDEAAAGKS